MFEGLNECLRHRVVRHLPVAGEGQERPPQAVPTLPVEALEVLHSAHAIGCPFGSLTRDGIEPKGEVAARREGSFDLQGKLCG
jgi:hypothetical protein